MTFKKKIPDVYDLLTYYLELTFATKHLLTVDIL